MQTFHCQRLSGGVLGLTLAWSLVMGGGRTEAQPLDPAPSVQHLIATDPAGADDQETVLEGLDQAAASDGEMEDLLQGFDEPDSLSEAGSGMASRSGPRWLHLSGSAELSAAVNLESHRSPPGQINLAGLSRLRGDLNLTADLDLPASWRARVTGQAFHDGIYVIRGRRHYTEQVLDSYENEIRLGEAWIRKGLLPGLDVQLGRQIVVWGRSDNIRVTDVINPLDMREPGMTDIEDLRLPAAMTRLDYAYGSWNLTGLIIHELRFDQSAEYGSDYFLSPTPLPPEETPSRSWDNQELGLAVSGVFSGWDLSFYGAYLFDDRAHLVARGSGSKRRCHSRITMVGGAATVARGNWLLKSEAAWFDGLAFTATPGHEYSRLDALLGVEYAGLSDTSISLELANRHLVDYDDRLRLDPERASENEVQWALRIARDLLHERLTVSLLASVFGALGQDGALGRLELAYDLDDRWELTAGVALYEGGDKPAFEGMKDNDRMFMRLRYAF